jgi:hypothetical protein
VKHVKFAFTKLISNIDDFLFVFKCRQNVTFSNVYKPLVLCILNSVKVNGAILCVKIDNVLFLYISAGITALFVFNTKYSKNDLLSIKILHNKKFTVHFWHINKTALF